jgi:hypothetical protein
LIERAAPPKTAANQTNKSFLLLFYKKEALASLRTPPALTTAA